MPWPKAATPYFAINEEQIDKNLSILDRVQRESGAKILLAQKAFSVYQCYPQIGAVLAGTTASGLYEARLGKEEMGGETHIFSPAYTEADFPEILALADHLSFNSFAQWHRFKEAVFKAGKSAGLRVNPECSTQGGGMYDPCAPGSRLGIRRKDFNEEDLSGIEGLHFHTLCEQGFDALETTLAAFESQFGNFLPQMRWLNLGGGHHITRADYDVNGLIRALSDLRARYDVEVYLEPGEAVVLNAGVLVATVIDVVHADVPILIIDASAACHMPDVLEVPYRPPLEGAFAPNERTVQARVAGPTCLAGDVVGDYSFDFLPQVGDRLVFGDMALYTMVKTNTFNGMKLPDIYRGRPADGIWTPVRTFSYNDFKMRL